MRQVCAMPEGESPMRGPACHPLRRPEAAGAAKFPGRKKKTARTLFPCFKNTKRPARGQIPRRKRRLCTYHARQGFQAGENVVY